ncbi:unnamed protein product [Ceutorhynchus assimilis]|uniref:Uncharacterized protein n=1 Tax=Ceutorhynchus assimilis TaxID=467358 RepID=A0A9N9QS75_9CUCU|nr:unnamed protein product [Ceutorhynchus assimilis]
MTENMNMTQNTIASTSKEAIKRLRFTADDDLALLREFVGLNPLEEVEKWEEIQKNIFIITGKMFSIRTLKDHLFLILDIWLKKDKTTQILSGVEEVHSERDQLLQEVSDMCNNAKVKPLTKKRKLSKEKQIAELGKLSRDECSRTLISDNIDIENLPPAAPAQAPSFSPIALDHDYQLCSIIDLNDHETSHEIQISTNNENNNEHRSNETETLPPSKPTILVLEAETPKINPEKSAPRKILAPRKNRTNRSAPLRRNALEYLDNKESREEILKTRQLNLEEKRIELENRRLVLDEQRHEMDCIERKQKLEMEKTRFTQEMFERDQKSKMIEQQHQLIQSLMERLKKYEEK